MKKITSLFLLLITLTTLSCAKRETSKLVNSGNYDQALDIAISRLQRNKDKKGNQEFVLAVEDAFKKAKERDDKQINLWVKDPNNQNIENIYNAYVRLHERQEKIKPLLPLRIMGQNRNAAFVFENYDDQIVNAKNALVETLYYNALELIKSNDMFAARKAYDDLSYVSKLHPDYKEINFYTNQAFTKGNNYVLVSAHNQTNLVIPRNLLAELLDFDQYGLQKRWTQFHTTKNSAFKYDYEVLLNFRDILVSPEQIREREITQEKLIKEGTKNLVDANGNVVRDSLGKVIKVDNMKKVVATVYQFHQFKTCTVTAQVQVKDLNQNQIMHSFPINSEFLFEHYYATIKGDRRACDEVFLTYLNNRFVPFPSNEQMIYDTGTDLKLQLKAIVQKNIQFP